MDEKRLILLQLCDTGFPSGAFSHSYGFETYVQEEKICDRGAFSAWLRTFLLEQWIYNEGLALRLACEALEAEDEEAFLEVDRSLTVQTIPLEQRDGGTRMGRRMLELARELLRLPQLETYAAQIREKRAFGQTALVFAVICRHYRIPLSEALLHYAYAAVSSLIQNGVRAIPLGQTDGQRLLIDLQPELLSAPARIAELPPEDFGISQPGLEMAAIRHERLDGRMFMS
jgi:urease accessory protein